MLIAGIIGFILLVYFVGVVATNVYILTLPPLEQSAMTSRHSKLVCSIWFVFMPFMYVCNLKYNDQKYALWYVFIFMSCLFNWISKVLCCVFTCLLLKSFWGIAVGWISFTVFYWIFLALIPKDDRQNLITSFHGVLESAKMGMPPMYFIPRKYY